MRFDALLAELRPYRKTLLVVTVAVIAAGLAWLLLTPSRYVSTAKLMVSIEGSTTAAAYQNDEVVAGRVNSYVALLTSEVVGNLVVGALDLPMSARDVAGEVSATAVPPKTSLIDVSVTDEDPDRARLLADTVTREFVRYVDVLETPTGEDDQKVNTRIVSAASEPRQPWTERAGLAAAVVLLGPLLGAVAVWIRARTDPVVRTARRAAAVSGGPVLARVEDIDTPTDDLDGYRRLRLRLRSLTRRRAGPDDPSAVWVLASPAGEADAAVIASSLGRVMVSAGDPAIALGYDESGIRKLSPQQEQWTVPFARGLSDFSPPVESDSPAADPATAIEGLRMDGTCVVVAVGPVLSTCAASVVGGNADGVLLIVVPAETRRRDLARAAESLRDGGVCPVGVVFVDRSGTDQDGIDMQAGSVR
ncbi:hypothetical protein [Rhodococcus zopfii]|uniref:hypothetical protein n=1 Tax=Rhodococcus zopfii TaxID=43772 RepID=UPI000932B7F7|nr:hypothetical protein [Rhodococcus zopfii]